MSRRPLLSTHENDGDLVVWLGDKGYDDPVGFRVDYSWVPNSRIMSMGEWGDGGTEEIYAASGQIPDGPVVLAGFNVSYISLDHHVARLAVYPDQITLYDNDRNDAIRGSVRWVQLGKQKVPYRPIEPPGFDPGR